MCYITLIPRSEESGSSNGEYLPEKPRVFRKKRGSPALHEG